MSIPQNIAKNVSSGDDLDFEFLRQEGIRYIESFGSKLWTDFNAHDPGMTMLDVLCFALTDLGNRINQPIKNLLSQNGGLGLKGQFFATEEILPSAPVSQLDYRKLIIDIPGIRNCWVQKADITVFADLKHQKLSYDLKAFEGVQQEFIKQFDLKGWYTFLVETEEEGEAINPELEKQIFSTYHAHRNLCEDLHSIKKVPHFEVKVCASVEVDPEANEELVHAHIMVAIETYLSPSPQFHSLREMTESGIPTEEIFEGPLLQHGFLDDQELRTTELRKEVRLSDLIHVIMEVEGVKMVRDITIGECSEKHDSDEWILCVPEGKKPSLCQKSTISYFKGLLPVNLNKKRAEDYKKSIQAKKEKEMAYSKEGMIPALPQGNGGDWGHYDAIQHHFPETYGLSDRGFPGHWTTARKAQAMQLKGYLLFFDQVLTSYFKQLDQVKDLLSLEQTSKRTYFTQAIKDIKGIDMLMEDYPDDEEKLADRLMGFLDQDVKRRNQIMDHLIARFAERFGTYVFLMKSLYGDSADEIVLNHKRGFLQEYDQISRTRGQAFNYFEQAASRLWDTDNVSGVQKRIARLAGISNYHRRNLSDPPVEIYRYTHENGQEVYRWRIRNKKDNRILLSATEHYTSHQAAGREMYFAILKILQTPEKLVSPYLETGFEEELEIGCFQIHPTASSGKFSFDIINPEITSHYDADRIIAKQYRYHDSKQEVLQAVLDLIHFIKVAFTEEGLFLVEHVLLLPHQKDSEFLTRAQNNEEEYTVGQFMPFCADDYEACKNIDPYSYRISVILPGYTYRFGNKDFRDFLENLIREELPAHVLAKICWIGYRVGEAPRMTSEDVENAEEVVYKENQLVKFEKAYQSFLSNKTRQHENGDSSQKWDEYNKQLNKLIQSITGLHTIYPPGSLYDCEDEDEQLEGKIILGKTNLGTH